MAEDNFYLQMPTMDIGSWDILRAQAVNAFIVLI